MTSCDLEEQLVRESEDMLEILFLIIGCICGLSGILFAFEWIMSGRHIKITKESKNEGLQRSNLAIMNILYVQGGVSISILNRLPIIRLKRVPIIR